MKSFARYYLESFGVNTDNLPDEVVNEDFRNVVWELRSHFSEPRRDALYTHNEAGYLVPKFEIEETCVACKNYIPGGECLLVADKVNPGGTCQHWQGWTEDVPRMDGNEPTKRVINWNGLKIGVTHESGDRRFGYPLRGVSYGRIYRSYGQAEDGKAIDCWIGPDLSSDKAFWFQQLDPEDGSPDEMKLVIGFSDRVAAKHSLQDNLPLYLREAIFGGLFDVSPVELDAYRNNSEPKNETKGDTLAGCTQRDRRHYPPGNGVSQSGDRVSMSSRKDSSRPSCLICVEKHLSNALILADEISQGYPQFRPLLIGNLSQASDEAVMEYPELAEQIRDMRHRYQIDGIMPTVDEVYALLEPYYSDFEPEESGFVVEDSASVGMPARSLEEVEGEVQREDKPDSSNDLDAVYAKYHATVNMSASELKRWSDNEDSKKASLDRSPIKRNLRLLSKPKEKWTQADIRAANRTISFVGRMKGAEQGKPVDAETDLSKRDISLRNWAYDPKKRSDADPEDPDTAELIVDRLQEGAGSVVKKWISTISSWIRQQKSLESAAEKLKKPNTLYDRLYPEDFQKSLSESLILADLAGRVEVLEEDEGGRADSLREDAPRPEWLRLPFEEAIAYFRSKISIPAASYKKMVEGYHDFAFSITGLTKGALLDDARWLVDKAISDGTSFDVFVKQWDRLIGRQGWEPKGDKNRRLYLIYDTNVRSAYGAGRGRQMADPDVAAKRPYILWRHRDSPNPRVNHQQLDGKAIALSDPFWQKVGFQAGWGCRCSGYSVSKEYCDRNGIEILSKPPDPETIAELGFRRPLTGMTAGHKKEVISSTLANLSPEVRTIVEKDIGGD